MNTMDELYAFAYKGILTDASLDAAGRQRRRQFGSQDSERSRHALSFDMLDPDCMVDAHRMSVVYTAIHAFENMVRRLVKKAMAETHGEEWWTRVPERIREKVAKRMEEDAQFRWHGARGATDMNYCDYSDLAAIMATNWTVFEDIVVNLEWAKTLLQTLERSRNICMHGGVLASEDIERIGMNIRDWIRQTG